jgi:TRAP-type C4-dicarboxylate transport system permease small subunit
VKPASVKDPVGAVNRGLNGVLAALASVTLLSMMALIVGNMLIRTVTAPLAGAFEVVGWLAAMTSALALGYTQLHKGHVDIDIVTRLLPAALQRVLQVLVTLVATAFFLLLAWRLWVMGGRLQAVGTLSESLRVAYHYFVYVVAAGVLGLAVALVADSVEHVRALWRGAASAPDPTAPTADGPTGAGDEPERGADR